VPVHPDLEQAIALYSRAPDAPTKASRRDWAVAHHLLGSGVTLDTLKAAIALASLRRMIRPTGDLPLEPIRSFAYFKPLAQHLQRQPPDPGYIEYLDYKFRETFPSWPSPYDPVQPSKTAAHRRNPALFESR